MVYHINSYDPFFNFNPNENASRVFYYPPHTDGNYYTPYSWIDGLVRGGWSYNDWWGMIENRSTSESPLSIQLDGRYDTDERTGNLEITIYAEGQIRWEGLKVRIALTEDSIYFDAPNGTLYHNFTMRDMIPDAAGSPLAMSQGETKHISQDFRCPNELNWERCRLVVWVQSDITER